jgi:hypothetical protein
VNRSQARWLLVVGGVVIWLLIVYPAYYVVHKPLSAANLKALAHVAGDLLTWLAISAVATALGSWMTRRLSYHSLLERLTFSAGLGLAAFSFLTLGLGFVGLLYRWLFWVLLIVGGLLLWREFRDLGRALRQARLPRPRGAWQLLLSLFIAATLFLALTTALLPPTAWDSLVYHLVGPDRYLAAHRLTYDFDNYYLFFPSFVEMLFTAGMALKGDIVPQLIHFGYLLLTLGALGAFATRHWERRSGLLAIALFLSIPTAVQIATWSYVDLALTFYSFAALYALLNWLPPAKSTSSSPGDNKYASVGWLLLAGLFGGAALSIKYTGVLTLVILGAVLLWSLFRGRLPALRFLSSGLVVAGLALVIAAPWYVKNAIVAGNPLYPLVWGGREWNEIDTRWLLAIGQEMSLLNLLLVPWTLTIVGTQGTEAFDSTYSPLFLTLLPLLLIVRHRARRLGELLLAVAVGYLLWIASSAAAYGTFVLRGRQLLPIFAPLSLLCAYSLEGLNIWDRPAFSLQRVLKMVISLTLIVGLVGQMLMTVGLNPWPYLVGHQSRDDYLDRYISQNLHQIITYANQSLTPRDKIFFVWELRSYGLDVAHEADTLLNNFPQRLAQYGSPEGVLAGLRQEGFTHILVNQYVYPWIVTDYPITPQEQAAWEEFQRRFLTDDRVIHAEGDFLVLYCLSATAEPRAVWQGTTSGSELFDNLVEEQGS